MKKILLVLSMTISSQLIASSPEDCKPKIIKVRTNIAELLASSKATQDQQNQVKDSAVQAHSCIMELKAPAGKGDKLEDVKKVWEEYQVAVEKEIIPKVLAGKKNEAKAIEAGIQNERIEKLKKLMQQLSE